MRNILLACLFSAILISAINCDDTVENPSQQQEYVDNQQDNTDQADAQQQDNQVDASSPQENITEQTAAPQKQTNQELINELQARKKELQDKQSSLKTELSILYNKFLNPSTSNEAREIIKQELYNLTLHIEKIKEDISFVKNELNQLLK